jgi:exonuclease SbcC
MVKKIKLKNFASHKDSELELDPGLNVIAGSTGNGKSVIQSGIEWCFLNNLRGLSFRPITYPVNKKDTSSVEIIFDNGSICRERNEATGENAINGYRYANGNDVGMLEALRSDVPEEIFDISRIDEINIQGQEDDRFLLSKHTSPGEVAKKLNEFCGLTIIDKVSDNVKRFVDEITTKLRETKQSLTDAEKEVKNLSYLDSIEPLFLGIDELINRRIGIESKVSKVQEISTSITLLKERITDNNEWLKCKPILIEVEELLNKKNTLTISVQNIRTLLKNVQRLKENIKKKHEFLKSKAVLNDIELLIEKRGMIVSLKDKVKNVSEQVSRLRTKIHDNQDIIKNKKSQLQNLLSSVDTCPIFEITCNLPDDVKSGKAPF